MTIQQFYGEVGGDAEEVLTRLMNEAIVKKFLLKFFSDPNYEMLITAIDGEDWETAFRAAHTLKGLCLTLGLGDLARSSSDMTEKLRGGFGGAKSDLDGLLAQVTADYKKASAAIEAYKAG